MCIFHILNLVNAIENEYMYHISLFVLILYLPVNNFSVMTGRVLCFGCSKEPSH